MDLSKIFAVSYNFTFQKMASQQSTDYKQEDLGPPVEELFDFLDSDDEQNHKYNSTTPGLIHVINEYGSNSDPSSVPNQTPIPISKVKSKITSPSSSSSSSSQSHESQRQTAQPLQTSMTLNDIVSSLYDMRSYIKDKSKATEYERLMHALLTQFDDIRTEKFNLMQQIYRLEQ